MANNTTWDIDEAHSTAEFSIRHMFTSVKGHFAGISGTIVGDPADLTSAEVHLSIDIATVNTRNEDRDKHLRSADFFDVEKYPVMTFDSRAIKRTGPDTYEATGDLSMHGVTRPVTVQVSSGGQGKDPWGGTRAGFSGTTTLNRKDFGLMWNVALEAGGLMVGDQVKVSVELETVERAS
jgi:polyisoprenoid-binding protein YceI